VDERLVALLHEGLENDVAILRNPLGKNPLGKHALATGSAARGITLWIPRMKNTVHFSDRNGLRLRDDGLIVDRRPDRSIRMSAL
jgi:hypothetical protein